MDSERRQRERLTLSFLLDPSTDDVLATRQSLDMEVSDLQGVYIISVAARLLRMHPQTLRKYERAGLVTPTRTIGMLRLYSKEDIARLKLIKHLVGDLGLNLAGVQLVLETFNHLLKVRARVNVVDTGEFRRFMVESLEETFELLHAHVRQTLS